MLKAAVPIILLSACSGEPNSVEIREAGIKPPVISGVSAEVNQTDGGRAARRTICLGLYESLLFAPGDDADALGVHLRKNSRLVIDSDEMPLDITTNFVGTVNYVYDGEGNLLGSRGDFANLCYDIDHVKKGSHVATFYTSTTSGTEYFYSFEVIVK
jgi:hypothetical protein